MSNIQINEKHELGQDRLIQEHNRIKLPIFFNRITANPNYMMIDNDSQSAGNWDNVKKSRLIESFIMNFPVLPIVIYERSYHSYQVIDGKQKLKTIIDFYSNKLTLSGLEIKTELNGCTYTTLPVKVKTALNRRSISSICIISQLDDSPEEIAKLIKVVAERYT
jgi:hypothetical protein